MKQLKYLVMAICCIAVSFFSLQETVSAAENNSIIARGSAMQEVAPDMAYINLNINGRGATAEEARNNEARSSQNLHRILLGAAITEEKLQNSSYNLYPEYTNNNGKSKQIGYLASSILRIQLDDLTKLSSIIEKVAADDNIIINQVRFALNDQNMIQRQLLAVAVENARVKAAVVANAGGRTLGQMLSADIRNIGGQEAVMQSTRYKSNAINDEAVATQLMPGLLKVNVEMEVTFVLK